MGSPIDLTYIYKLSIVKIKSIGSSNNQATTVRKDISTLRKLVLINTFIERKMASYEELLLAKRNSANMNIGCGKIVNNVAVGGNGARVKLVNVTRPNAVGNGVYSNPAANVSSSDLGEYDGLVDNEDEYERPVSPPPPYSPPSSPAYQHVQTAASSPAKKSPKQQQHWGRPSNNNNNNNYNTNYNKKQNYQQQKQQYYQQQKRQQHYQHQQEHPSKNDFNQFVIPVQLRRNVFHPVEQVHYQQQYHPSQGGYFNQLQPPQKAVQRILIPLPVSPKQNPHFANIPPPRYAQSLPPSHRFHLVKLVRRPQLVDNGYY